MFSNSCPNHRIIIPKRLHARRVLSSFSQPLEPKPMLTHLQSWHPNSTNSPQITNISSSLKPYSSYWVIPTRVHSSFPVLKILNQTKPSSSDTPSSAGKIKRLVLSPEGRTKLNPLPDREFYSYPRLVTHVDDDFIATLTDLYRERIRPGSEVLDLMSSWVSHLPKEVEYKRVVGHGMNAQELARNGRLEYFFVKDLNVEQGLELKTESFDAVLCTVSVQYLQQPEKVFAEVFRVLKPGGVFIVSFSNRLFYEKAISAWRDGSGYSRVQLVVQYFQSIEGFTQPEVIRKLPGANGGGQENKSPFGWIMRFLGLLSGSDPFYAVIAYKNFKPFYE